MEPNRVQFLENKTLLVTGACGFLAKVFVERVLRLQPNVKRLYLVVRAIDNKSAEQRLHNEVFEKDLFKVLKKNIGDESLNAFIKKKVVPVPGDISLNNMGVNDTNLLQDMMQEIDIVFHASATTRFDERYDVALRINTFGALNVLSFAKKCVKAQLLLHFSTVNPDPITNTEVEVEAAEKHEREEEETEDGGESKKQKVGDEEEKSKGSDPVQLGPKEFVKSMAMFDCFTKFMHFWPTDLDINKAKWVIEVFFP